MYGLFLWLTHCGGSCGLRHLRMCPEKWPPSCLQSCATSLTTGTASEVPSWEEAQAACRGLVGHSWQWEASHTSHASKGSNVWLQPQSWPHVWCNAGMQSRHAPFEFWNPMYKIKSAEFAALCCTARVDFKEGRGWVRGLTKIQLLVRL